MFSAIDPEGEGLEGVEGEAHRDEDRRNAPIEMEDVVEEEIPVFVVEQWGELEDEENKERRIAPWGPN